MALFVLLLVPACAGSAGVEVTHDGPVCFAVSYEAGGDHAVCGEANANPVVVECDRPTARAQITPLIGTQLRCRYGTIANSWCCADLPAPNVEFAPGVCDENGAPC